MENPIKAIIARFNNYVAKSESEKRMEYEDNLRIRLKRDVQPVEYNGELYIGYNGIPLVNARHLHYAGADGENEELTVILACCRDDLFDYLCENQDRQSVRIKAEG